MNTHLVDPLRDSHDGVVSGVDVLGAYHLLRPIATGGMARVWLAVDARDGREVAVKRMLPQLASDAELCRAFADEAALGLRLRHPNIIDTLEVGDAECSDGTEPYLVLELLRGRTLIEVLRVATRRGLAIPLGFAMQVVRDAARGLDHAHRLCGTDGQPLRVVHRDVTPHNLFVCTSGSCKVLDFGIAKAREQAHRTRAGVVKGKFAYLAPEQIAGRSLDARLDVFALGIVLHELLTGTPLFRAANDTQTLHQVLHLEVPPPERLRPAVPAALGALTLRALQRDRDRRLPTAGAMADSIEAIAEAERIPMGPAVARNFLAELFPADAREHAEDAALARRTYEFLSSSSLRALGSDPWLTPAEGVTYTAEGPVRTWLGRAALVLGAITITALGTYATLRALEGPPPAPPGVIEDPATPR